VANPIPALLTSRADPPERAARYDAEIARVTVALVAMGATRVVLFGSRAAGRATRWSDADLMAVMPCPAGESLPGRWARVWQAVAPTVALDLLVYTPEEWSALLHRGGRFVHAVAAGRVLHGA
jgi:predicted nucleotidyltransferase